ncbi:MAG: hypothetical protein ACREND_13080 [Gemmatimonadaceae bacterium]
MVLGTTVRRILLGLGMVLVLAFAANGLYGGIGQLHEAVSRGERVQSYLQIALGVIGILVPIAIVAAWRSAGIIVVCWTVVVTLAGGMAPVVWARSPTRVGLIAGVACLVIALGIVWLLRTGAARPAGATDPLS